MSLWEIHPIIEFLVCQASSCDPQNETHWTPLETWAKKHPPH